MAAPYPPPRANARAAAGTAPERRGPVMWSPGLFVGALGALGVLLSLFFPWRDPSVYPSDVPLAFLWDKTTKATDPSLLVILIPTVTILIVGAFSPFGRGLRAFGAIVTFVVVGLFAYQLSDLVSSLHNGTGVGDVLSTGFYLASIGALFSMASAFVRSSPPVRRAYVEDSY